MSTPEVADCAPTVALIGLSGVGKSRLAARIAAKRPEFLRLSAGKLLREAMHTTGSALRTAPTQQVIDNQRRLVEALRMARSGQYSRPILLEAHAFIDNDRDLVDVPVEVMKAMSVAGLLVLVAPPEILIRWREDDDDRRRPERSVGDLTFQQEHMLEVARTYARELPATMAIVQSGDLDTALGLVDKVTSTLHA